jgi:hypothetical protein
MDPSRPLCRGPCFGHYVGFFFGKPVVEGFPLALLTRGHPELVGLAPVVRWVNHRVAVVVSCVVGVGRLARAQGLGVDVFTRHSDSVPLESDRLNTHRRHIQNPQICADFPMRGVRPRAQSQGDGRSRKGNDREKLTQKTLRGKELSKKSRRRMK